MKDFNIDNDTICAISTPPGAGGIAVARVSGPEAIAVCDRIWRGRPLSQVASHTAHLGDIVGNDGKVLDQAVATVFRTPKSFTGEDTVEISVHGSRWIQRQILTLLTQAGARPAEGGEFTRRAFAAGKLDLAQAEAVADLIASSSKASHRIALNQMRGSISTRLGSLRDELLELSCLLELELDFSEEDVEFASRSRLRELAHDIETEIRRLTASFHNGSAIKEGIPVAIIGHTNAGKSSLLNALVGDDRAIVSDIHGTTRDIIEDTVEIGDFLIRFRDTAGLRETSDKIENLGIDRSRSAARSADLVLYIVDSQNPASLAEIESELSQTARERVLFVVNKSDLDYPLPSLPSDIDCITISAKTGDGIDKLREEINRRITQLTGSSQDDVLITNARHAAALEAAGKSISAVGTAIDAGIPADLIAQDLRETIHHLSTVTGAITTPEILNTIFQNFCIGK